MVERQQRASGLRHGVLSLLACAILFGWPAAAAAGGMSLSVSATIVKHASLTLLSQPGSLMLTAADVAQGYVDARSPTQLAVRSNSPGGYMLVFETEGEQVRMTQVRGLGSDVQLGTSGGVVPQSAARRGMNSTTFVLGYRFVLSQSAQQGVYAWPIRVSVIPR